MNTFPFVPGLTWGKTGFLFFSNSLAYREVLEANTGWDITGLPPPGTLLNQPASYGMTRGLNATSMGNTVDYSNSDPLSYYPYSSKQEYIDSIVRYPPSALRGVEKHNGWSLTSDDIIYETSSAM